MKTINSIKVVLDLPRPIASLILRATNIQDEMTINVKTFPSPAPTLAVLATHIAALTTKEAAAKTRASGTAAVRDAARKVLLLDLNQLKGYVEVIANADPDNALSIAAQAGMALRKNTAPSKPPLATKQPSSGVVHLVAKAVKGAKANEWQYSTDGGKTWLTLPTSTRANTVITGLQAGVAVTFRHRAITKVGPLDWGQPISTIVT